jgi:hypothetical protein
MTRLLAIYPRAWRERYGAELRSLLDERRPSLADRFDLIRGAFDAHRHPELVAPASAQPSSAAAADTVVARRLGIGTLFGIAFWFVAWYFAATGPIVADGYGTYRDGSAAYPFLIIAGLLVAAGLCGQLIVLPRSGRVARAGALLTLPSIILWTLSPWVLATFALTVLGLALLGVGTLIARSWPRIASLSLLGVAMFLPILVAVLLLGVGPGPITGFTPGLVAFIALPSILWLTIGGTLLGARPDAAPA